MYTRSLVLSFISLLTLFTVNIAQANTEIPDYYDEPGYSQVRQSGQELLGDNVDPFSGQLTIAHTDLFLPGNGGLDLSIVRSYSSHRAGKPALNTGRSIMGQGWDMHMGRIYFDGFLNTQLCPLHLREFTSEENPVLELPDGSKKVFYANNDHFITKDFWRGECIDHSYIESGRTYEDGGMLVTSPDGVVYRFDRRALTPVNKVAYVVTSITDARGNSITINYRAKPVNTRGGSILDNWRDGITNDANGLTYFAVIDRIIASDGRQVNFSYFLSNTYSGTNRGLPVIRQISTLGRFVTYSYNDTPDFLYLDQVHQSDGGSWNFDYHPYRFPACSLNCDQVSVAIASSNKINRMTSPLGASVRYEYEFIPSGVRDGFIGAVTNRQIVSSGGNGTWVYSYDLGSNYDETTITTPVSTEVYRHFGSQAASDGSVWRIGTLLYKSISGGGAFQTETYEWDSIFLSNQDEKRITRTTLRDTNVRIPVMVSKQIVRDGTAFATTYRHHNSYGVPTEITESSGAVLEENIGETSGFSPSNPYTVNNIKHTSLSYYHNIERWILNLPMRERVSGTFNTAPQNGEQNWNGEVTRTYYSNGLLQSETANNITTQYTYTPSGDIESVTDANNHRTTYSDYDRGIPQEELKPNGIRLSREVDNLGRVISETDGRRNTKVFTYDGVGRLRSITPPLHASISIEWPSQTTRVLTRGGFTERRRYDSQGYELSRTIEGEETIAYTKDYDVMGRLRFESYPNSTAGVSYQYDALNRITRREEPGGKIQTYNYKNSNRVDVTDGLNNTVEYFYRSFGSPDEKELIGMVEPEGTITQIRRDITGNIVRLNQNGIQRAFVYDARKFLISESNPETGLTEYGYDFVGNLKSKRVNGSQITGYSYDDVNRLVSIEYPVVFYQNGERLNFVNPVCSIPCFTKTIQIEDQFEYDGNNNKTTSYRRVHNGTVNVTSGYFPPVVREEEEIFDWSYDYDENDNLIEEQLSLSDEESYSFTYTYNAQGSLSSLIYPSGLTIDYFPDNYGRPTQIGGFASGISYHPTGSTANITYANGVTKTTQLNERLNINSIDFGAVGSLGYIFDEEDNIAQIIDTVNDLGNKTLNYDGQNRLISATGSWGSAAFGYDENNNITSKNISGILTDYSYDSQNRLTAYSVAGESSAIAYDLYGNVVSNGQADFDYDHQGNLISSMSDSLVYRYDAQNRRVKEKLSGGIRIAAYGMSGALLYERDQSGKLNSEYIYLGSQLIAKRQVEEGLFVDRSNLSGQLTAPDGAESLTLNLSARAFNILGDDIASSIEWRGSFSDSLLASGGDVTISVPAGIHVLAVSVSDLGNRYTEEFTLNVGVQGLVIDGGAENDILLGDSANDTINGGEGADQLQGMGGSDTLIGGPGDDLLIGGGLPSSSGIAWGIDTFVFNRGDGADTIVETEGVPLGVNYSDILRFGPGILPNEVTVVDTGDGYLFFFENNYTDVVRYIGSLSGGGNGFLRVEFANGESWSPIELRLNAEEAYILPSGYIRSVGVTPTSNQIHLVNNNVRQSNAETTVSMYGNEDRNMLLARVSGTRIIGGEGADVMLSSQVNNTVFYVDDENDLVKILPNGIRPIGESILDNVIVSSVNYTLPKGVGSLITQEGNIDLVQGNSGDNLFHLLSDETRVEGHEGDDIYVVLGSNVEVVEEVDGGQDTISIIPVPPLASTLVLDNYPNFENIINITSSTVVGNGGDNVIWDRGFGHNRPRVQVYDREQNELTSTQSPLYDFARHSYTSEYYNAPLHTLRGLDLYTSLSQSTISELRGGAGNDVIFGGSTIIGGAGDDDLYGARDRDTRYIYSLGDGNDIILDSGYTNILVGNRLAFSSPITLGDLEFVTETDDLVINIQDGSVRLVQGVILANESFYYQPNYYEFNSPLHFTLSRAEMSQFVSLPSVGESVDAVADELIAAENSTLTIPASALLTNDLGTAAIVSVSNAVNGSVEMSFVRALATTGDVQREIRFTPLLDFVGLAQFDYSIIGRDGVIDTVTVTIDVRAEDSDLDGDGVPDQHDAFPDDPAETHDTDGDGIGDNSDPAPNYVTSPSDLDGDGVENSADAFPNDPLESLDTDGDGVGDNSDFDSGDNLVSADSDGDGIGDHADSLPYNPYNDPDTNGDGVVDALDLLDTDGDGVLDSVDAFPMDASEILDSDGDGVGDNADDFPNDANQTYDLGDPSRTIGINFGFTTSDVSGWNTLTTLSEPLDPLFTLDNSLASGSLSHFSGLSFNSYSLFYAGTFSSSSPLPLEVAGQGLLARRSRENTWVEYTLSDLDPDSTYRLTFFSSVKAESTQRRNQTAYITEGQLPHYTTLEATGNRNRLARLFSIPDRNGDIKIRVQAGPDSYDYEAFIINAMLAEPIDLSERQASVSPLVNDVFDMAMNTSLLLNLQADLLNDDQLDGNDNYEFIGFSNAINGDVEIAGPSMESIISGGPYVDEANEINVDVPYDLSPIAYTGVNVTFEPDANFVGVASFDYIVRNKSTGLFSTATVSVNVLSSGGPIGSPNDTDGDGVINADDVFPNDPAEFADTDGDGVGDHADIFNGLPNITVDSDGDGISDYTDEYPNNPTKAYDLGEPANTIGIDFGEHPSADWNNVQRSTTVLTGLSALDGSATPINLEVVESFSDIHRSESSFELPSFLLEAVFDSLRGSAKAPRAQVRLTGLDVSLTYRISFIASERYWLSDVDQTQYTVEGASMDQAFIDYSREQYKRVWLDVSPDTNGELLITVESGPDNTTAAQWFYLSALTLESLSPSSIDTDSDGVVDADDAFPNNSAETSDSDGDGVGDNADAFPLDFTETLDRDGDGVGDNGDEFPLDPARVYDLGNSANTIGLDFGQIVSPNWNSVRRGTRVLSLSFLDGQPADALAEFSLTMSSELGGTRSPIAPYPYNAVIDYSSYRPLIGGEGLVPSIRFSNLDPLASYRLTFFASAIRRHDNTETEFVVSGSSLSTVSINPSNNVNRLLRVTASPDEAGVISVELQTGPNNSTQFGEILINALTIEEVAPITSYDADGDGVDDREDAFPNDPSESADTDRDGVGDNADAFPNDPAETADSDGDGVGDNADAFPSDASEIVDTDGDGVGDNADLFPSDASESSDSDGDGLGDNADAFPNDVTETIDSDGDGVGDNSDAFPNDATESVDSDGDGIGDNTDSRPNSGFGSADSDGDGVNDNDDAFPGNASETTDSDGDGLGDNADAFPNDPAETEDTDGDGVGDNADPYPNDPLNRETFTLIDHFTTTEVSPMTYQLQLPDGEPVEETVSLYRDLNGVVENADGSITKTTPDSWWGSGVFDSLATLAAGSDGWIEFSPTDTTTTMAIGWSAADMAENYGAAEIQYRLWLEGGVVQVFEGTEWRETLGVYQPGDTLRIERQSSTIVYRLNGIELYSSTVPSLDALRLEGFIYDQNATIPRPTYSFEGNTGGGIDFLPETLPGLGGALSYRDLNGVLANADGSITKTTPDSWWGSGVFDSEETLAANTDGWVEFTVTSLSSSLALGLAPADMADNFGPADITYRIFVEDGAASVYEGMNWVEGLGSLAVGDTLRIERQGSSIIYWLNGVVSYTSTLSSTEALRAEGFIYNQGASIAGIEASFGAVTEPPQESYFYTIRAGDSWPIVASLLYSSEGVIDELQSELGSTLPQVGDDLGALPETIIDDEHTITVESHYPLTSGMTWSDIAGVLYGSTAAANELEAIMTAAGYSLATSDRLLEADMPPSITVTQ